MREIPCDTLGNPAPVAYTTRDRGLLIAVEGIDGAGKTTQVRLLADALTGQGFVVVTSKEPTEGEWGQAIRQSAADGRFDLDRELDLFILDRTEHARQKIEPALKAAEIVILDRYYYSTIAYQGSRGKDARLIQAMMEDRFPHPDVVFLLDVTPAVALHRIRDKRGDRPNEFEREDSLARARDVFNSLRDPRVLCIDGNLAIDEVGKAILARTHELLIGRFCRRVGA